MQVFKKVEIIRRDWIELFYHPDMDAIWVATLIG